MRSVIAVLALLTLPSLAWAQRSAPPPPPPSALAPIGLPLPPIGLPLPPIGLPASSVAVPSSPRAPQTAFGRQTEHSGMAPRGRADRSRWDHKPQLARGHAIVYLGSPYYWPSDAPYEATAQAPDVVAAASPTVTGVLRLEIEPPDRLQLFVDGVYIGTIEDTAGELALDPGTRRIEIRKPDYEPLTFDARIVAGRTITYRGPLTPVAASATATLAPEAGARPADAKPLRQTFYLIPGCYMGNIPPEQVQLAPGCDRKPVITYTP